MISAVVTYTYSSEVDEVGTSTPLAAVPDPFVLDLAIGPAGDEARDDFSVLAGTREALRRFRASGSWLSRTCRRRCGTPLR
jgi:hypothetical protein